MEDGVNQVKSTGNPILDSLRAQKEAPIQEAPVVENTSNEVMNEGSSNESVETAQVEGNTEVAVDSEKEETGLEDANGDNPSIDQGSDNAEGNTTSETEDDDTGNWWESDEDVASSGDTSSASEMPEGDYGVIGKALGLESNKADDVLSKITEITTQNQELSEKVAKMEENSNYANPDLEAANEVARNGGDYLGYLGLSQNNWDGVEDDVLLTEGKLRGVFGDDEEGMKSYLNEMDPVQKKFMASEIRQGLKQHDEQSKADIVNKANEQRRKIDNGLRTVLDETKELFGLKMTPSLKKEIYNDVTVNGTLTKMFHDNEGNPSPKKMIEMAVLHKYNKKVVQTAVTKARNQGAEDILNEVSNPIVNRNGSMANPAPKAEVSAFQNHFNSLRGKG